MIWPILKKTPNELWKNRKSNTSYFHIFGYKYFILNNGKDNFEKFDAKLDEDILLGYSLSNKTYRVFSKMILIVEESRYIVFDETNDKSSTKKDFADDDARIIEKEVEELTLKDSLA